MFQKFSEDARKVLKKAKIEMKELKHPFVGTEHLVLSILSFTNLSITKKLKEYGVTYEKFKKELITTIGIGCSLNSYFIYTPMLKRILENAIIDSKEDNRVEVNVNLLFLSLLDEGEGVANRIFSNMEVDIDELYSDLEDKCEDNSKYKNKKRLIVYDHAIDLVEKAKNGKIDPVIGRDMEIERLIEILLRRNKNNPLLIGEAGVGKTAIVEALALKISKREVPDALLDKKILSISMANLVAGTKYRGEFEDRIEKIIKEIEGNPNLIIFIDEMHSIVGAGGAEGAIDAANILKPALARGKFRLIGATTIREYKDTIEKDKALNRRFQTILITEPNLDETVNILKKIKPLYEKYHNVIIPDSLITEIVTLSNKYIYNRKNPDKSLDILDEVCARRSLIKDKKTLEFEKLKIELGNVIKNKNKNIMNQKFKEASKLKEEEIILEDKINNIFLKANKNVKKEVLKEDISKVIKSKVNIPVYEIDTESRKKLKGLEKYLKNKIVGQDEAIELLCKETNKIKLGLKDNNRPNSFLFLGKSGVGKTELVKEYSKYLNINLIRIDGSEYKESHTISKIIGSPPGYVGYEENNVLDEIKNNPFSIILIDEIEKASTSFINLFLQILDEGFITNSILEKIYFNHAIIIMTSNTTSNLNSIGFNEQENKLRKNLEEYFSIEFLNRIEHIVRFKDLDKKDIEIIVNKKIKEIKDKFQKQKIDVLIQKDAVNEIIELSNYQKSGARKLRKLLEDKVDNLVIDSIIEGNKRVVVHK